MAGEILVIVEFIRWLLKGCKTDLEKEIQGDKKSEINTRGLNYAIGILIFLVIILLIISF